MLVGTNWKMNKLRSDAAHFSEVFRDQIDEETRSVVSVFVIPSVTALDAVDALREAGVRIGVQNIHWADEGSFTGEISARQAVDAGASIIEVGHSERRANFCETDDVVARKTRAAISAGATALVCVGETRDVYEMGKAVPYVQGQVKLAISLLDRADFSNLWIAYEPVWAIGEGSGAARPKSVAQVHSGIRAEVGSGVPILYGGSVNKNNATEFLSVDNVDGLFVGRFALDPEHFIETIRVVARFVNGQSKAVK